MALTKPDWGGGEVVFAGGTDWAMVGYESVGNELLFGYPC